MKRLCIKGICLNLLLFSFPLLEVDAQVKTGIDVLAEEGFEILKGKRVGLLTYPTGVDRNLRSTIDILYENVDLRALYGPEHGVSGDFSAGDRVGDQVDEKTGIPVYSLYGRNRKSTPEVLQDVDVIVYDIQDIGVRSYTFISTIGLVMEAAVEQDKEVLILDRLNPLGGRRVEGPLVEEGYSSFVSQYSISYIYGGKACQLSVVSMEGWTRDLTFEGTGLQWVPTSPHIPQYTSAFYYPATGIIGELDAAMIGIGYTLPFQVLVTENIDAEDLSDSLNASLTEIQFLFLQEAHKIDPDFNPFKGREDRFSMFDKVLGSDVLRKSMLEDFNFEKLRPYWNKDKAGFLLLSEKYYLC